MTAATRYSAEEIDPDSAARQLVGLWSTNLRSMGAGAAAKLAWFYRSAPTGSGRAVVLRAHRDDASSIVGCQGIGFRNVWCDGVACRAALLADLAVEREHRTLFPALTLVRHTREIAAKAADFQYGFPNDAAIGLFKRVGFHPVGEMVRYVRVLRFAPYFARRSRHAWISKLGGSVVDLADAALRAPRALGAHGRFRLEFPERPDPRFDELFEAARRSYKLIGDRGRDFLHWRFFSGRVVGELAALRRRGDEALRAYAVFVRQGDTAHLSDFLAASEEDLRALLLLLVAVLRARGCSSVSVRFLGTRRIPRLLARCGFRRRDADRAIVVAAGRVPVPPALVDVEGVYFTDADEDE